ncbi:competence factor transport ComB domain protein [Streptococcus pneumoniae GA41277]|nr:competence factor transport ComB domain protein [Streptococcus pneumoniae GA41277]EJG46686.1 transport protein comB domain protein [Streptococcus pneumoniae 2070335]
MKPEFLESAEFYNRRYHNFSSSVIVPMALLLVFLLGFATVAEKEMSLSTRATVEPSRILANIQSTSNNRILVNHLEENKLVKKGDLLVQYQEGAEGVQAESYASQLDMLKDQKSNWSICKRACKKGRTTFQRRISLATKPPFATTSVKQAVLGLVHRNKMRPSRPRMQQLAKPKPKSATSSVKQRLKFAITRQLSQLLKQVLPWPVRI